MRCEEKVPGGKMVCVDIGISEGKISSCRITGDFFLHPEERIDALESSLLGMPASEGESAIAHRISDALGDAQLIGAGPGDIARIAKRAMA